MLTDMQGHCSGMSDRNGRIGIMQPYFFPYLGYFALMAHVDRWVVFDVTQYTPKTWMNRNRVLHPLSGWMYVTVPVRHVSRSAAVSEVFTDQPEMALASIVGKLAHYRNSAPHFADVLGLVERGFRERADDSLVAIDTSCLRVVCDHLGMPLDYSVCSAMDLDLSRVVHPGQWALHIAEQLGAAEYVNPLGGASLFREEEFEAAGVGLSFLQLPALVYDPSPFEFVPSLSILDVLMWNDPASILSFVRDQSVLVDCATATGPVFGS